MDRLDTALEVGGDVGGAALAEALVALQDVITVLESKRVALVAAFDASGAWGLAGSASTAAWLSAETGMGRTAARSLRRVCVDAVGHQALARAAAEGRLSHAHVRALVDARRDPVEARWDRDEEGLVAAACVLSVDGLARHLAEWY